MSHSGRCCRKSRCFGGDALDCVGETWSSFAWVVACSILGFSRCARELGPSGWPDRAEGQGLKVLYDCGEMEFVARAGQPAKPHAFKSVVDFKVSKTHLDALTFIP